HARQVELQILRVVGDQVFQSGQIHCVCSLSEVRRTTDRPRRGDRERAGFPARPRVDPLGKTEAHASVRFARVSYATFSVSSPGFQLHGQSSSVCSASSTRSTSATLRPTFMSVTETKRMTPCGSTMNVARFATPSSSRMPSALDRFLRRSDIIGNGSPFRSGCSRRHARCTNSLSTEAPSTCASRSANASFCRPNSAISVGQTNVKSFGQKNTTSHLPGYVVFEIVWNASSSFSETVAFSENSGNLSPTVNIIL